ncbi:MAG TPA: hypothetical protein V6C86_03920 [Oculatellaceae cyanobacterium]
MPNIVQGVEVVKAIETAVEQPAVSRLALEAIGELSTAPISKPVMELAKRSAAARDILADLERGAGAQDVHPLLKFDPLQVLKENGVTGKGVVGLHKAVGGDYNSMVKVLQARELGIISSEELQATAKQQSGALDLPGISKRIGLIGQRSDRRAAYVVDQLKQHPGAQLALAASDSEHFSRLMDAADRVNGVVVNNTGHLNGELGAVMSRDEEPETRLARAVSLFRSPSRPGESTYQRMHRMFGS